MITSEKVIFPLLMDKSDSYASSVTETVFATKINFIFYIINVSETKNIITALFVENTGNIKTIFITLTVNIVIIMPDTIRN